MIDNRYFVEPANWMQDAEDLRQLRETVFIIEQKVSREEEWDGLDPDCLHVIARETDGLRPIGTGRLSPTGKIGRMAVRADWRGQGVGSAMLRALIDLARERKLTRVYLHAQLSALDFYLKHGFVASGEIFTEADIEHRRMQLDLPYPEPIARGGEPEAADERISRLLTCDSLLSARAVSLAVLERARHEIMLYTRDLEAPLYDNEEILEQFRRVALSGRRARVRILLQDTARASRDGHRLVGLAQRLSSVISIRQPINDDLQYAAAFLLNDRGSYLFRTAGDRFEGEGDLYHPPRQNELQRYFDAVWERSVEPVELRRLSI
jgi:predicted GNAT family N-acyltransferase